MVPVPALVGLRASGYASDFGPGYRVRLMWDGEPGEEYNVFRAENHISRGLTNPLILRTPVPTPNREFVDIVPRVGLYIYQVRAVRMGDGEQIESRPAEVWVAVGPRSPRNLRVDV